MALRPLVAARATSEVTLKDRRDNRIWYLALIGVALLALTVTLLLLQGPAPTFSLVIRGAALMGYMTIFLAILSSAYMRYLVRIFGRSFIKIHHILSVTGLALATLHPIAVAVAASSPSVFLPRFDSLRLFLQLGGRPAWFLLIAASLVALGRKAIGRNWLSIHFLNYVAFLLITVHALLIGTDFQGILVKAVGVILALAAGAVFVRRRLEKRRRRLRSR